MSVQLDPSNSLGFPRPLTQLVKRSLTIHNPNPSPIAFKVKTTAPKQYCVRPNSGRVEAGESIEVQVLLQPLAQEPPPHAKCKDKFLVQSAFISPDEEMRTLAEMWSQTEKTNKAAIHEQKLKCAYLPAEDGSTGANGIPEEPEDVTVEHSRLGDESAIFAAAESSPSPAVTESKAAAGAAPLGAVASSTPAPAKSNDATPSLTAEDIAATKGPSPADAALEKSVETTTPETDKLAVALQEIEKLRAQLAEAVGPQVTGLRKRGGAAVQAGTETAVEKTKEVVQAAQGVPVEVVGGLLLAVFVLTYLFF